MLTAEQREAFDERGFIRIPAAFSREAAAAMEDRLWSVLDRRFGAKRDDPDSWETYLKWEHTWPRLGGGLQPIRRSPVFLQIGSAATCAALDDLIGPGRWLRPSHWGSLLVTFPSGAGDWTVPSHLWHTDYGFAGPRDRVWGSLMFSFLSTVPAQTGGTLIVQGSHRVVRRFVETLPSEKLLTLKMKVLRKMLMRSDPWLAALSSPRDDVREERIERFMESEHDIGGTPVRVVELTGEPGDIVLTHPWMLHCGSPNHGSYPRLMCVQRIRGEGFARRKPNRERDRRDILGR